MDKVLSHKQYYDERKEEIKNWKVPQEEKKKVFQFIDAYETGKITRRTATNVKSLIERNLYFLRFCLEHLNKNSPKKEDIEKFFDGLFRDKYKSFKGEPYSIRTKREILASFIKYLKWKFPDKPELSEPLKIDIKSKTKEPSILTLDEIDTLYKGCKNEEERYFIAILFSSGTRAEEFLNIRYSDFTLPKGEETYAKVRIRNEFSKTEGRTISLYYKNSLEALKDFLAQRIKEGIKPEEPIFLKSYSNQKKWLNRLGQRVLHKSLNFHLFRHTCATWLASRLNRQQMCIYFGWKFSSPMPDVYIKRDGVMMEDATQKFKSTDMEELKIKGEKLEEENKTMRERQENLEKQLKNRERFDPVLNKIFSDPKVLAYLQKAAKEQSIVREKKRGEGVLNASKER